MASTILEALLQQQPIDIVFLRHSSILCDASINEHKHCLLPKSILLWRKRRPPTLQWPKKMKDMNHLQTFFFLLFCKVQRVVHQKKRETFILSLQKIKCDLLLTQNFFNEAKLSVFFKNLLVQVLTIGKPVDRSIFCNSTAADCRSVSSMKTAMEGEQVAVARTKPQK